MPASLASRIFLTFAVLLVALVVAGSLFVESRVERFHVGEIERRLDLAAAVFTEPALAALADPAAREQAGAHLASLARESHLRITVILPDGEVVAETSTALPIANHRDRPEIVAAAATGRGTGWRTSRTTATPTYYLARRIDRDGTARGFIRVGADLDELTAEMHVARKALVVGGLAALCLGLVGAALLARRLALPLQVIERGTAALEAGFLDSRVRPGGPREVRRLANSVNRMADQLQERIDAMERRRSEFEAILASMKEGVVAVNREERVLLMNRAAARALGLERPLPQGAQLWEAVRFPELELALRAALAHGKSWHGDAAAPVLSGRVLAVSVTPVAPGIGAVALLFDVTDIRRLEKIRIDFVANVSHEMRTPLTAVLGALETLAMPGTSPDEQARFLDIAQRNSHRMQNIVADLLELSTIEAEGDRMSLEPTDLARPVRTSVQALVGSAEAKRVRLEIDATPPGGIPVSGNEKRLEQVFTNLVENAIKYTPGGGSIAVRFLERDGEAGVAVADTGIGIPPESLPRVFERFYRVDKSRSREMGGTGLGLAIVKHVVRGHGGRVEVKSEVGHGTTFTVWLPRAARTPAITATAV